jgi:hypothetical protein
MGAIRLEVQNAAGSTLLASVGEQMVSLIYQAEYRAGDRIFLAADAPGQFCIVQFEDSMPPAQVYLPGRTGIFPIPFGPERTAHSPKNFSGSLQVLRARFATDNEIAARHNLALNPYDGHSTQGIFPHTSANVETRDEAVFAARNAIDGIFENTSHGAYPFGSWGINRDPGAVLRLEFGRAVRLDEIRLTLRADFPHDSYWVRAALAFSDGTRETLSLAKSRMPQCFSLMPRIVEWLELRDLIKAEDASPFPALTQLEAYGTES